MVRVSVEKLLLQEMVTYNLVQYAAYSLQSEKIIEKHFVSVCQHFFLLYVQHGNYVQLVQFNSATRQTIMLDAKHVTWEASLAFEPIFLNESVLTQQIHNLYLFNSMFLCYVVAS